jgi:hypothetical protein
MAEKHGLGTWLQDVIHANRRKECEGTQHEVEMLARLCDDDRIERVDVPKILEKSYRQCVEDSDFDKIKKLPHVGIYSKISTLLNKDKNNKRK